MTHRRARRTRTLSVAVIPLILCQNLENTVKHVIKKYGFTIKQNYSTTRTYYLCSFQVGLFLSFLSFSTALFPAAKTEDCKESFAFIASMGPTAKKWDDQKPVPLMGHA